MNSFGGGSVRYKSYLLNIGHICIINTWRGIDACRCSRFPGIVGIVPTWPTWLGSIHEPRLAILAAACTGNGGGGTLGYGHVQWELAMAGTVPSDY